MAAPGHTDIVFREPADANPANDTDPVGGAKTTTTIADNALDKTINTPTFSGSDEYYNGIVYLENLSSGQLTNARVFNRCALKPNPTSGLITFGFENGSDSGNKLWVVGYVGGLLLEEYVTCPSAAGFVSSVRSYDSGGLLWVESVNSSNVSTELTGPVTVSRSGTTLGVLRGSGSNPPGKSLAVRQLYQFGKLALASAKNTAISTTNRKTAPASGISAFDRGASWDGLDESLPVPTNVLGASDYVGVVFAFDQLPANMPTPAYGRIQIALCVKGNALA